MNSKELNIVSTVTKYEPNSIIAEAYRTIRTAIKYSSLDKGLKSIMVTSSIPNEGKTSTISNLAILMAQDGNKVLLIDGDLRRPHLHHIFRTSNRTGLSTTLTTYSDPVESVQETDIANLSVLPSGPIQSQPSELLGSPRLEQVIDRFRRRYDIVLIDTPPLLTVSDASLLARVADGVVLVTRIAFTRREQLKQTQKNLLPMSEKVIGVVVNDQV